MHYLLDTSILLIYLKNHAAGSKIDEAFAPLAPGNIPVVSVVSFAELKALALKNSWGARRQALLDRFLDQFLIADIHAQPVIERYAEIDAFSQGKLEGFPLGDSARNMGKNDLWIAATASVLKCPLITTDKDFLHLDPFFLKLELVDLDGNRV
ncbi:MAG: PIN domain-containing protein [Phaeodactylibacter sp.]|nr:PIN domain-containing protein [Phaeodactylibacter sp.]